MTWQNMNWMSRKEFLEKGKGSFRVDWGNLKIEGSSPNSLVGKDLMGSKCSILSMDQKSRQRRDWSFYLRRFLFPPPLIAEINDGMQGKEISRRCLRRMLPFLPCPDPAFERILTNELGDDPNILTFMVLPHVICLTLVSTKCHGTKRSVYPAGHIVMSMVLGFFQCDDLNAEGNRQSQNLMEHGFLCQYYMDCLKLTGEGSQSPDQGENYIVKKGQQGQTNSFRCSIALQPNGSDRKSGNPQQRFVHPAQCAGGYWRRNQSGDQEFPFLTKYQDFPFYGQSPAIFLITQVWLFRSFHEFFQIWSSYEIAHK